MQLFDVRLTDGTQLYVYAGDRSTARGLSVIYGNISTIGEVTSSAVVIMTPGKQDTHFVGEPPKVDPHAPKWVATGSHRVMSQLDVPGEIWKFEMTRQSGGVLVFQVFGNKHGWSRGHMVQKNHNPRVDTDLGDRLRTALNDLAVIAWFDRCYAVAVKVMDEPGEGIRLP